MENQSHIIAAVIFIVILGGAVVGGYFWLRSSDQASRSVVVETQHAVSGVSTGTQIMFKGLDVGHVESIGFAANQPGTVRIVFKVQNSVPLNTSSFAKLSSQGIIGMNTLSLHTPNPHAAALKSKGNQPPQIPFQQSLMDTLKEDGKADLKKVDAILDHLQELTGEDNVHHIKQTLQQIDQATRQLALIEKELKPTLNQLPGLTKQIDATVASAQHLMKQAQPALASVRKAADTASGVGQSGEQVMRKLNERVLPQISDLTQQLGAAARQVQSLASELSTKPQSLLTGPPERQPGPGEPGFQSSEH